MAKLKMTDWEWLTVRVLVLGFTVFMWSFITEIEGVREAFGDRLGEWHSGPHWYWGFRHFVYTITFGIVTVIQIIKILKWVAEVSEKSDAFEIKVRD